MNKRVIVSSDCANALKKMGQGPENFGLSSVLKKSIIFDYACCLMEDMLSFNIVLSIAHPVSVVRQA